MSIKSPSVVAALAVIAALVAGVVVFTAGAGVQAADAPAAAPAALSVAVTSPQPTDLRQLSPASGRIAAWQEASIGAEVQGLRLAEVAVNVGDKVRRGQVLARFAADTLRAEMAQIDAGLLEAEAALADARANAQRARGLKDSGALSAQQIAQYLTGEKTAEARLAAQRASRDLQALRLAHTQVLAPDDGVISARQATVGAVVPAGQELFRLIRKGRLEWHAEVPAEALAQIQPGQTARLRPDGAPATEGTVHRVAPTIDARTGNGLVYVILPAVETLKAGMFARGEFEVGARRGLTLPASAVMMRDGFHQVFTVGDDGRVQLHKVGTGQRVGDRIEITGGLPAQARVVASGGAFLSDGDAVRVVTPSAEAAAASR